MNGIRACTYRNRWYYLISVNVHDVDSSHIFEVAAESPPGVETSPPLTHSVAFLCHLFFLCFFRREAQPLDRD